MFKVMTAQLENDQTSMVCLEGLPEESLSKKEDGSTV